jgi:hypothetical protein
MIGQFETYLHVRSFRTMNGAIGKGGLAMGEERKREKSHYLFDPAGKDRDSERERLLDELLRDSSRSQQHPGYYPGAGEYYPSHVLAGRREA